MQLMQLVYVSRSRLGANDTQWKPELDRLIASAKTFNAINDVTGYLVFDGIEFAQVLEGHEGSVMGTFLRIASDRRHENMQVINRGPIRQRQFDNWQMGMSVRNETLEHVFKANGFVKPGQMSVKPFEPVLRLAMQLSRSVSPVFMARP